MATRPVSLLFAKKKCSSCEGGVQPLTRKQALDFLTQIDGWSLSERSDAICREYRMRDFMAAVKFIGCVAKLAEKEDHHPDIHLTSYRKLKIDLSTHAIGGLSENDFILAAKIDKLPESLIIK